MIKKINAVIATIMIAFSLTPAFVLADCANPTSSKEAIACGSNDASGNSDKTPQSVDATAKSILNLLSAVVGIAAVFMIILSGFRYITSSGNDEKVKTAKRTLLYAVIGLAIVALTQTIVHLVLSEANHPSQLSVILRL